MVILIVRGGSLRKVVPELGCQVGPAARERNAGQLDEDDVDKLIPNLWKIELTNKFRIRGQYPATPPCNIMEDHMSATTQTLIEQLEELKIAIAVRQVKGEDVTELMTKMTNLQEKLSNASQALTESKHLLKG